MDIENQFVSYVFKKQKNAYEHRNDFHCHELIGFAHVRFSPFDFSKKSFKKRICENTRI